MMQADAAADSPQEDTEPDLALWDEIEARYWASISAYRDDQDLTEDGPFLKQEEELSSQQLDSFRKRTRLLEDEAPLRKKFEALRKQLESVHREITQKDEEVSEIEARRQELAHALESQRKARAKSRAKEDAKKHEWFSQVRLMPTKPLQKSGDVETPAPTEVPAPGPQTSDKVESPVPVRAQSPCRDQPPLHDERTIEQPPSLDEPPANHDEPATNGGPAANDEPVIHDTPAAKDQPPPHDEPASHEEPPTRDEPASHEEPASHDETMADAPPVQHADESMVDAPPVQPADEFNGLDVIGEPGETLVDREIRPLSSEMSSELSTPLSEPSLQFEPELEVEDLSGPQEVRGAPSSAATPSGNSQDGIDVLDGSGEKVDRLRRIELTSHWASEVISLPIRRPIRLRPGKTFTADIVDSIYQPTDAKGARWLSCEIQATGEEQAEPCQKCVRATGPFQECVSISTEHLPRCGNCEWNKQSCSLRNKSSDEKATDDTSDRPTPQSTSFTAVNSTPKPKGENDDADTDESKLGDNKEPPRARMMARKSLPGSKKVPQPNPETPAVGTPISGSPSPIVFGINEEENLPEITKATLALRDDGVVFTEPPCMRGVPLAKISPSHPYWEQEWQNLEDVVTPQLQKWKEKYEHHMAVNSSQSSKFLANRQVNRGNSILKFLVEGELHPYQIVGKQYVNRQLANYDTLYRMVQILEELAKFNIDMTPSQWLRQRLHEVCLETGDEFNLAKTVHDLYHDPKVIALRTKSGFGNIGRPSGFRLGAGESSKRSSRAQKRKEPHLTPKGTPTKGSPKKPITKPEEEEPLPPPPPPPSPPPVFRPRSSHRKSRGASSEQHAASSSAADPQPPPSRGMKKPRLVPLLPPSRQDLECDGYTTSDSFSRDHVMQVDWRIYQIKHRDHSTNIKITQYWHYIDNSDPGSEESMFEHQVLEDVLPAHGRRVNVKWGVYKDPIDFHLRLRELTEITYSPDSLNIIIGTKPIKGVIFRGDLLAQFKRDRTKRRFLAFMESKGIKLIKTS